MTNPEQSAAQTCVYGPVPSRRLGYSLGVDILPFKTCSLDCVYCQLGPTSGTTVRRRKLLDPEIVLSQIRKAIDTKERIDFITFSGSGEPTLHSEIGPLIRRIKTFTNIPVAVLTNATFFTKAPVRNALLAADLVVPSLDAADQDVFLEVNRPHGSLHIEDIIRGLILFRSRFQGRIWLEILFVKGLNDSPPHLEKLKKAIARIKPDKTQLNTVIRPPADHSARPLTRRELEEIRQSFQGPTEIIAEFKEPERARPAIDLERSLLSAIRRRPMTLEDLGKSLGDHPNELLKHLDRLIGKGLVKTVFHKTRRYYEAGQRKE